jgi:hypothetical protein
VSVNGAYPLFLFPLFLFYGYQAWHRALDDFIIDKIVTSGGWMPVDFIYFLVNLYATNPDLVSRFPNGIG